MWPEGPKSLENGPRMKKIVHPGPTGADDIKKFTPSLGIPYLGV